MRIEISSRNGKYHVEIGCGILDRLGLAMNEHKIGKKVMVITNQRVNQLYGEIVKQSLSEADLEISLMEIPDGEQYKTIGTVQRLYDNLINNKFDRNSSILAFGGGVVGDIAGFVAATFMRGINLFHAPTTLLAQIDSAIGGKVAINHPLGKNLIGTFYQPKLVWSDLKTLKTLPHRQFISGMAEVVKSAMIGDKFLFDYLDKNLNEIKNFDEGCLQEIVSRSCNIKARIVEIDEMDFGLRMLLNYGHTIGHALESLTEYKFYTHGEAISIGMMVEAKISHSLGHLSLDDLMRQEELLKSIGLPTHLIYKMPPEEIVEKLFLDKKARNGKITFALPEKIGKAFICHDVPVKVITKALEELAN